MRVQGGVAIGVGKKEVPVAGNGSNSKWRWEREREREGYECERKKAILWKVKVGNVQYYYSKNENINELVK